MTEQVTLYQLRDGNIVLSVARNARVRWKLRLTPENASHLAHRLMSFVASQHDTPEVVLEGSD